MITPGHPDGDGGRRNDLAEVIKALKSLPLRLSSLRVRFALPPMLSEDPVGPAKPATALTGYVLAWRQWGIASRRDGSVHLVSFYDRAAWPQRAKLVATCVRSQLPQHFPEPHLPPEPWCSCGIYALKNGAGFLDPTWAASQSNHVKSWTVGKVALWGRVLEGEEGFRAQYAYPYALWTSGLTKDKRVALGSAYGVEVNQMDANTLKAIGDTGCEFVE